jgi:drug/metabolite transporter (DMT)-like permease
LPTVPAAPAASARHLVAIPLISLLWGMNWPTQGFALREVGPWTLRALTLCTAGALLVAFNLLRGRSLRVPRAEWARLVVIAFLYFVLQNILISFAQLIAPSGRMAIVTYTMPIWTAVLAAFLLHEPLTPARRLSLAFGALGLVALAWPALHTGTPWGWLLALGAGWCWAASVIVIKRSPFTAAPLAVTTWQVIIGGVSMVPGMLLVEGPPTGRAVSGLVTLAIVYNVFSQAISQVLWFETLGRMPAALATLGVLLVPAVAIVGSIFVLHEIPTLLDCVGLVLITCASAVVQLPWLTTFGRRRKPGALGV